MKCRCVQELHLPVDGVCSVLLVLPPDETGKRHDTVVPLRR